MAFRILFVCTGNTCRSPMAEGLCRSFLGRFLLLDQVEVASAGLHVLPGELASREAVAVLAEKGIDLSGHRAIGLAADKVQWADLILTMEGRQKQRLLEQFPEAAGKAFVLKEYVAAPEAAVDLRAIQATMEKTSWQNIPDPFGQPAAVYRQCAMELASAVADLCMDIYRRLKQAKT